MWILVTPSWPQKTEQKHGFPEKQENVKTVILRTEEMKNTSSFSVKDTRYIMEKV